ncbi:hypothetical protein QTP86_005647 [Hemibagrus guttatus]|nr:hypothetical protein QTP86_005647 [Hemibagrus guttatus]
MDKRKDLSEFDKGQIVMARPLDQNISKTAALVGCSRSAVVSIYQKWSKKGIRGEGPNWFELKTAWGGTNAGTKEGSCKKISGSQTAESVHQGNAMEKRYVRRETESKKL